MLSTLPLLGAGAAGLQKGLAKAGLAEDQEEQARKQALMQLFNQYQGANGWQVQAPVQKQSAGVLDTIGSVGQSLAGNVLDQNEAEREKDEKEGREPKKPGWMESMARGYLGR